MKIFGYSEYLYFKTDNVTSPFYRRLLIFFLSFINSNPILFKMMDLAISSAAISLHGAKLGQSLISIFLIVPSVSTIQSPP